MSETVHIDCSKCCLLFIDVGSVWRCMCTVKLHYSLIIKWMNTSVLVLLSNEYLGGLGRFLQPLFHIQFQHGV
jgi:hypothetical protein